MRPFQAFPPRSLAAIAGLTLILSACSDSNAPSIAPMRTGGTSNALEVGDPTSDRWNRFEADVYVAVDGATSQTMADMKVSRGFSYHLTRRRDDSGRWLTDMDLGEYRPRASSALPTYAPPPITRIKDLSRTTTPRLFDANDQSRVLTQPPTLPSLSASDGSRPRMLRPRQAPAVPRVPARATQLPSDTSRDWADQYFVHSGSVARLRAALAKNADDVQSVSGQSRFVRSVRGRKTEVVLDDATGQIRELRVLEGGKPQAVTTREYTELMPGVFLLRAERTIRYSLDGDAAPVVIITTYRNVRVLEER